MNSSARTSSFTTALAGSSGVFTQERQYNEHLSKDQFLHHCYSWIFRGLYTFTTALAGSSGVFTQGPQYNEQLSKDQFLHHCSSWIFTQGPHTALHSLICFGLDIGLQNSSLLMGITNQLQKQEYTSLFTRMTLLPRSGKPMQWCSSVLVRPLV